MANRYIEFLSDQYLLGCIETLHNSYVKAKGKISKKKFYNNKIDTFKLTFDANFNQLSEERVVEAEILRQVDKSINNSIGTFHEQVLGGILGYQRGNHSGFDIKAEDDTLFADIKNKHNTMNSSAAESLFQKLAHYADTYKKAKGYWVQILAKGSFSERWFGEINGKEYSHTRVYKISGDQFYYLLTGRRNAFYELYKELPLAIKDFLELQEKEEISENSALFEIESQTEKSHRSIFDEITFENYSYYLGFNKR